MLFPTTLVGSYPQPEWLIDRDKLAGRFPARELLQPLCHGAGRFLRPEDLILAPDCGMKYLPRQAAYGKMCAMVEGAKLLRAEYS